MFVRVTWSRAPVERLEEGLEWYRSRITPALKTQSGFLGVTVLLDRASGDGLTVTYWDAAESMAASEALSTSSRENVTALGVQTTEIDRFEEILRDRGASPQLGSVVRVNDLLSAIPELDDAIGMVEQKVIPAVRDLNGYRAGLMAVNRLTGRMLVGTVWTTSADEVASRPSVASMRDEALAVAHAQEVRVRTYESVFIDLSAAAPTATTGCVAD